MTSIRRLFIFAAVCSLPICSAQKSHSLSGNKNSHLLFKPTWTAGTTHQVAFKFQTRSLNCPLLRVNSDEASGTTIDEILVTIHDGHLQIIQKHGTQVQKVALTDFISDNALHTLQFSKDCVAGNLRLTLDDLPEKNVHLIVDPGQSVGESLLHTVIIGGQSEEVRFLDQHGVERFHGCISDIKIEGENKDASDGVSADELARNGALNVGEGCVDQCESGGSVCQNQAVCVDDIDRIKCDCSRTLFEGENCTDPDLKTITLNGVSYIAFDARRSGSPLLYSTENRIGLDFKTTFDDGFLFTVNIKGGNSGHDEEISVTALIVNKHLRIEIGSTTQTNTMDIPDSPCSDGSWHTLALRLKDSTVIVRLDQQTKAYTLLKSTRFVYFSPHLSVAGSKLAARSDPHSHFGSGFVGCLRRIYYGSTNILAELNNPTSHSANLRSLTKDSTTSNVVHSCQDIEPSDLALTLLSPLASASIQADDLHLTKHTNLQLQFRLPKGGAEPGTLISGNVHSDHGDGHFKITVGPEVELEVSYPDQNGLVQLQHLQTAGINVQNGEWHIILLEWLDLNQAITPKRKRQDVENEASVAAPAQEIPEVDATTESAATENEIASTAAPVESVPDANHASDAGSNAELPSSEVPSAPVEDISVIVTTPVVPVDITVHVLRAEEDVNLRMAPANPDPQPQRTTIRFRVDSQILELSTWGANVTGQGSLHLGRAPERANTERGLAACVRNIKLDDNQWDVRKALYNKSGNTVNDLSLDLCSGINQLSCQSNNPCQHDAICKEGVLGPICECAGTGYVGRTCHLPKFMQTCMDLYLAGERRSGVHQIDLDGTGPLKPVRVQCNMSIQEQRGTTIVGHNLPPNTEIKKGSTGGIRYDIQYRNFDKQNLKKLVDISKQCRQHISYKCKGAPLKLHTHTWFRSVAEVGNITSFGSDTSLKCSCATNQGLVCALDTKKDLSCNCDADDLVERVDDGYFTSKEFVGITNMTFINREIKGHGLLTLGQLECYNKEKVERTVAFTSSGSYLQFKTLGSNEDISFFFRTAAKQALLVYQAPVLPLVGGAAGTISSLRIAMTNASTVTLFLSINGETEELSVVSPKLLNNAAWHLVKIEFGKDEVQLTVNLKSSYLQWNPTDKVGRYQGPLYVGGHPQDPAGLIGCLQGFVRGSESIDLGAASESLGSSFIKRECQSSCSPNPCNNDGECFDKFGDYECICANPVAHSGKHCETNINIKPVTFANNSGDAYILLKSLPVPVLKNSIALSFRTHRPSGIFLYTHDNFNNFLQLHLDGGNQLILTFNSGNQIKVLKVGAEGLSDGHWHQIYLHWKESSKIVLSVDTDQSAEFVFNEGESLVLLDKYKQRPWGIVVSRLETIVPPRPRHEMAAFRDLYLGGLSKPALTSSLPGFYGCLRGLKIGDHLVDLMNETDSEHELGVLEDCIAGCEKENPCRFGGSCISRWGDNVKPTECDCTNSSYTGVTYTEDIGANLDATSNILVEYKPGGKMVDISRPLNLRFAFSTNVKPADSVTLLFIQFYEKLVELAIVLNSDGDVVVELYQSENTHLRHTVKKNCVDSARHSVLLSVRGTRLILQVDKLSNEITLPASLFGFVHFVTIGHIYVEALPVKNQGLAAFGPFTGCISNVKIEAPDEKSVLEPLKTAILKESIQFVSARMKGSVVENQCAFPAPIVPTQGTYEQSDLGSTFAPWELDLQPAIPVEVVVQGPQTVPVPPSERNIGMIVGIICGIFLLVVLIAVIIYLIRINRRKKKYSPNTVEKGGNDEDLDHALAVDALLPPGSKDKPSQQKPKVKPQPNPNTNQSFDRPISKFIDDAILPSSQPTRNSNFLLAAKNLSRNPPEPADTNGQPANFNRPQPVLENENENEHDQDEDRKSLNPNADQATAKFST